MKNYYLLGMKGIRDCNNRKIQLEYYVSESENDAICDEPVYGIKVVKYYKDEQKKEKEESFGISRDKKEVERLGMRFMDRDVMPSTLLCLIDDYITLRDETGRAEALKLCV